MKRSVALLLLFFSTITCAAASECNQELPGSVPLETGHRAYATLEALQHLATGHVEIIQLCVLKDQDASVIECVQMNGKAIGGSRVIFDSFSDDALKGALAHELGHLRRNVCSSIRNPRMLEWEDKMADAFAIALVGPEILRTTYIEYTGDEALVNRRISRAQKILKQYPAAFRINAAVFCGRCRDRTCDLSDVNGTLYH